ncbi:ComEC/Rec2 family competence protein [Lacisediminihabitans changchengi]|uniref:ComEC/Rec2 family competence protein n=1 Tax=Lacisediminihabitans changchengi TaxID=2787634 RepID=A0A934W174_9MICO|nr:ComEC/Rec2 family competence protein [Lacisediminihabitans changchengi]MBK4346578.1 ComEC/Rec2 family competence protein [Lacisediminihabitans changchengi]
MAIPVAAAWAVTAVMIGMPGVLPWAVGALVALAVGTAVLGRRWRWLLVVSLACATAAVPVSLAAAQAGARHPAALVEAARAGRQVTVLLVVDETMRDGHPFAATLTDASFGETALSASVPIAVFPQRGEVVQRAAIGSTVSARGVLVAEDPGESAAFRFFVSGDQRVVRGPPWFLAWADGLRADFRRLVADLPGDGARLLPGLSIGDTSAVTDELDASMKASSLTHLTAVSGANCAVIIALVMLAGARLGLPRGGRIGISLVVLLGFVVLVTPEPSVLRAAVMAGIVLAALASGRPTRGLPVLALAVIVLLIVDPWLARSYGFALSVLATGGLLLLARPLAGALARWLPMPLAVALSVPLAAQLACQPVLILLNPSIPTYGVIANVLAEPAAPVATVLGLVACVLAPWVPPLAHLVAAIAWVPSAWIAAVAGFFAGLPGNALAWPGGVVGVVLIGVMSALVMMLALGVGGRRGRRVFGVLVAASSVGYLGVVAGDHVRGELSRPADWQIAACDIGQGDAVLVRSLGTVALIDTGPDPKLLSGCLDTLGISRIDLLVLSHYDLDHVGGTPAVFGRVDRALLGPVADKNDQRLADDLAAHGAAVEHVSKGMTGVLGELGWEVLWPKAKLAGVQPGNDASVTLRFRGVGACAGGCLSALFLGDLGEQPQTLLMAANRLDHVAVVKVAHHGSADQNERLYGAISADVGVIGVGADNDYGHPTDALLGILRSSGTAITRTDLQGMVLISARVDGGETIWTERSPPGDRLSRH